MTADRLLTVAEKMAALPWPDGADWLAWEIDGFAGRSSFLLHVLPLPSTEGFGKAADRRWGARSRTPARLTPAFGTGDTVWWRHGGHAVVLTGNTSLLVLPVRWLTGPDPGEHAHRSPLVAGFLSGDGHRVLDSVWAVFRTRDPEVLAPLPDALDAIEKATSDLGLGGVFASNRDNLGHALDRIRLFRSGTCLCAAYPAHVMYNPAREKGHVRIVGTVPNPRQWEPDQLCECLGCGRRFQVEHGEYHYPWWQWKPLTTR